MGANGNVLYHTKERPSVCSFSPKGVFDFFSTVPIGLWQPALKIREDSSRRIPPFDGAGTRRPRRSQHIPGSKHLRIPGAIISVNGRAVSHGIDANMG